MPTNGYNLLTHTRMSCARTCLRKCYYCYELGIRRERISQPLRLGSAVHLGLDMFAKGAIEPEIIEALRSQYAEIPAWAQQDDEALNDWQVEGEIVVRLVLAYIAYWGSYQWDVVHSEQSFRLPIINPDTGRPTPSFEWGGKIDKIAKLHENGQLVVVEHKTAGESIEPESDYWKRLLIDQQISAYMIAARRLGFDVTGVIYDVIRKPMIRPKKLTKAEITDASIRHTYCDEPCPSPVPGRETVAMYGARLSSDIQERPEFYFARKPIPRLDADLRDFESELWDQQQDLRARQLNGHWYRNTNACLHPYKCEYFDICTNAIDVTNGVPSGFVRVEHLHPELEDHNGND